MDEFGQRAKKYKGDRFVRREENSLLGFVANIWMAVKN